MTQVALLRSFLMAADPHQHLHGPLLALSMLATVMQHISR